MNLQILGSSSKGNCYLFRASDGEILMVECGVSFTDIKKALNFDISGVVGCLISHEHQDHAKQAGKCLESGIDCWMSNGTAAELGITNARRVHLMQELHSYKIGSFTVHPFNTEHDAREPFGFLIHHPEMGTALFATDTYFLEYTFQGLNNILIECNYRKDILEANVSAGKLPEKVKNRTLRSHCSFDTCRAIMEANDLTAVNNIVLIHLSDGNSNAREFQDGIAEATGKTVHVAEPGMTIPFDKTPF